MKDFKHDNQVWKNTCAKVKQELFSLKDHIEIIDGTPYDKRTGEDVSDRISVDFIISADQAESYSLINDLKEHQQSNGGFVFAFISESQTVKERFPELNQADYARLIYLSTYLSYNSGDFNYCYLVYDNGKKIDKKALRELLDMSRNRFSEFYKKLVAEGILVEMPEGLAINPHVFYRGKGADRIKTDMRYTRLFKDSVRDLYMVFKGRNVNKLGILYAILPYVNFNFNIICENPTEVKSEKVKPMEIRLLADRLGYSDYKYLVRVLRSIKHQNKPVFKFVTDGGDGRKSHIIVNPSVVYAGNGTHLESIKVQFN